MWENVCPKTILFFNIIIYINRIFIRIFKHNYTNKLCAKFQLDSSTGLGSNRKLVTDLTVR